MKDDVRTRAGLQNDLETVRLILVNYGNAVSAAIVAEAAAEILALRERAEQLHAELETSNANHRDVAHRLAETGIRLEHEKSRADAMQERCAKVADEETSRANQHSMQAERDGRQSDVSRFNTAFHSAANIATAIRALGKED